MRLDLREQPLTALLQCDNLGGLGHRAQLEYRRSCKLGEGYRVRNRAQMLRQKVECLLHETLLEDALRRVRARHLDEHRPVNGPLGARILRRLVELREAQRLEQQRRHGHLQARTHGMANA